MYRSRFRVWKRKHEKTVSDVSVRMRHTSSTTIYTNRANRHVIDRMLQAGESKWYAAHKKRYEQDCIELSAIDNAPPEGQHINNTDMYRFIVEVKRKKKRDQIQCRISSYENREYVSVWSDMTCQLYNKNDNQVGRLVVSNRIIGRPTEQYFIDPDRCSKCKTQYVFNNITNINVCPSCGYTRDVLFISEDNSQDTLVTKDPGTGSVNAAEKTTTDYHYVRSPLYRRYLSQFSTDAPPIPTEIMRVLYKYLSNIHLQNSIRCRPTPVANILRTHGFSKWANMSIRITKVFNGEPVPSIPTDLIERLVHRFDLIFHAASARKQKLPSFDFITNILLRIEGRVDLAQSFALQKTRTVLRKIYKDLSRVIDYIRDKDDTVQWENMPIF
jgi:predicted Zn-ribbon and HTH transcriptional regulator